MSSYLRLAKRGYALGIALLDRRPSWSIRRALARVVRLSPGSLARFAYVFALVVVISLLLKPERSHGQFRGIPATPIFFPGFPFNTAFSASTGGFTGSFNSSFMTRPFPFPAFPILGPFYTMPGPSFQFPLFNFTDSTSFFNPYLASFGGFGGFGAFGTPFGFQGFSSFGFGNGLGFGGYNSSIGLNGFGLTGFGGFGGMGGFAGKGFGGFNGKKAL